MRISIQMVAVGYVAMQDLQGMAPEVSYSPELENLSTHHSLLASVICWNCDR